VNNATLAFSRSDAISDTNFGIISGTGRLIQQGEGILTLTKEHTYSGDTLIKAGTLALSGAGAIASSSNLAVALDATLDVSARTGGSMSLPSGATLSGDGTVNGNFVLSSGARLTPGQSIGTLTFGNALTLAAGSTTLLEIASAPAAHDMVRVLGELSCGGTLIVTNVGGEPLAAGDNFQLFDASAPSGSFSKLVLPALGADLAWDTNGLVASGTLAVISTARPAFSSAQPLGDGGFRLTFTGPSGQDYELRASTNAALQPITLWDLLGSGTFGVDPVVFDDVSATNYLQRFYLIRIP
jgi:autotransporter-associated beta strand protein